MHLLNFYPRKKLGQNFLIDKNIIRKITGIISLAKDDIVLEIGAGQGVLTQELIKSAKNVIAVELDRILFQDLKHNFSDSDNIELINEDILKINLQELIKKLRIRRKINVVANIPYSITTPILEYLFKNIEFFNIIYLMVQKEFALRLAAKLNTKDYSSMSCFAQFHAQPALLFQIKNTCFWPRPKVDSYFIRLKPKGCNFYSGELKPKDNKLLFKIIRTAFNQRRKNILNSLKSILDKNSVGDILTKLNIDFNSRAENISLDDFIKVSNLVYNSHIGKS